MDKKYDIVIVSGGFDPMLDHHVDLLQGAKAQGHKVIAGLNSDKWLVNKKGKPFLNFKTRSRILSAVEYVDEVMSFNDDDGTAIDLLTRVQRLYPECSIAFANGGGDRGKGQVPEEGFCKAYNIELLWSVGGSHKKNSSSWALQDWVDFKTGK